MQLTVGVEEEFLLLDPGGALTPLAGEVVRLTGPGVGPEFMAFQVETATSVCHRLEDLRADLVRLRRESTEAAHRVGARLVASGLPPFAAGSVAEVTQDPRYRRLAARTPRPIAGACACQVHVGIPDRELGVAVLGRLRPWLATLLALTANSPMTGGHDSGWSSTRYRALLSSPTFRPPRLWSGAEGYDQDVRSLIHAGSALDTGSVHFLARLSARYPTVEVRVADTCLEVDDALLLAALVRALVATLLGDLRTGRPSPAAARAVEIPLLTAARLGSAALSGAHLDRLLTRLRPALEEAGDWQVVTAGMRRLHREGSGAERQRALLAGAEGDRTEFTALLADRTSGTAG